jgi:hypothetical protein
MAVFTRAVADQSNPRSLSGRARGRRWGELVRRFPGIWCERVAGLVKSLVAVRS